MKQLKLFINKSGGLVIRGVQIAPVTITEEAKGYLKEHICDVLDLHRTFGSERGEQILEALSKDD